MEQSPSIIDDTFIFVNYVSKVMCRISTPRPMPHRQLLPIIVTQRVNAKSFNTRINTCSTVAPMVWIENQLVGAYEGQTLVLECHSEAYPRPIAYWTKSSNETIVTGR